MKTINQKKQIDKNLIGSVVAGVVGAVAVAGVAVAATMALKDEKTRDQVKKMLVNVKGQTLDYIKSLKDESDVVEGTQKIKEISSESKKVVDKTRSKKL